MACAYLLCGEVGSGKTTYATSWQAQTGGFVLSCDDLMLTLFDTCIGPRAIRICPPAVNPFFMNKRCVFLAKAWM